LNLKQFLSLQSFLLLICAGCLHARPQAAPPPAFLAGNAASSIPSNLQGRGVRRLRPVELNIKLFHNPVSQSMEMNFFSDVVLTVEWAHVEKTSPTPGFAWTGRVAGMPQSQATMVVSGEIVTANITRGDGIIYQIRTAADGKWWVREIEQKEFPRESEPLNPLVK
jgi:hypothetical protein